MDIVQREALQALDDLRRAGHQVGTACYNVVLNLLASWGRDRPCNALFQEMKRRGVAPDSESWLYLVTAHAQNGDIDAAGRIVTERRRAGFADDLHLYTTLISACARRKDEAAARRVAAAMASAGIAHNEVSTTALASSCGTYESALEVVSDGLRSGLNPTLAMLTILLQKCAEVGCAAAAEEVFCAISDAGLAPDHVAWTVLLSAYGAEADLRGAARVWGRMREAQLAPNAVTHAVMIKAATAAREHRLALATYAHAESLGLHRSVHVRTKVLLACAEAGDMGTAEVLRGRWQAEGISTAVGEQRTEYQRALARAGQVGEVTDSIPDGSQLDALLRAYAQGG